MNGSELEHWRKRLKSDSPLLKLRPGAQVLRKGPDGCSVHIVEKLLDSMLVLENGERFWRHSGKMYGHYYQQDPIFIECNNEEVAEAVEARTLIHQIQVFAADPAAVYLPIKDLRRVHQVLKKVQQ